MQESFNRLILTIMRRLATKKRSPVYTGFFASSWKADTSPIKANDELEEHFGLALARLSGLAKGEETARGVVNTKLIPGFIRPIKLLTTSDVFISETQLNTLFTR